MSGTCSIMARGLDLCSSPITTVAVAASPSTRSATLCPDDDVIVGMKPYPAMLSPMAPFRKGTECESVIISPNYLS